VFVAFGRVIEATVARVQADAGAYRFDTPDHCWGIHGETFRVCGLKYEGGTKNEENSAGKGHFRSSTLKPKPEPRLAALTCLKAEGTRLALNERHRQQENAIPCDFQPMLASPARYFA